MRNRNQKSRAVYGALLAEGVDIGGKARSYPVAKLSFFVNVLPEAGPVNSL